MTSVLQSWVEDLPFMQQSVLIAGIRGPDGINKDHVSKLLIRWMRRCILFSAFERTRHLFDAEMDLQIEQKVGHTKRYPCAECGGGLCELHDS